MVTPLSFLPYTIAACTSSNEEGNPNQLALSRPTANNKALHSAGWLSERFCSYPQALVFRLASGLCRIRKIEVLVHHYMISTKLEFWVGRNQRDDWDVLKASADTAAGDQSDVKFEHLGFVSLNDGAQVQYKARELKSVHIDAEAEYLKIVVHKCHVNTLNLYNQVGLVAINIFGNVCDTSQFSESLNEQQQILLGLDPSRDSATDAAPHDNSNAALWGLINETSTERRMPVGQSLSFSGCADPAVAKLIVAVTKAKEDAVVDERFHDAKVLKILLEKCKEAGDEVNKLHTTKAKAVSIEDYDTAARMKADIAAITHALHSDLKHCGLNVVSADSTSFARPSNDERAPEDEHGTSTNHSAHSPEHRNRSSSRDPSLPPSPPSSKHASPPKPHDRSAASVPPHTILQSLPWDKGRVSPNLINVQAAREKQVVIEEVPLSQQKHPTVPVHSPPRSASVSDSSVRQSHPEPLPAIPAESPPSHENPGQSPPVSATVSAPSTLPVPPIPKPPQSQQRQESLPLAAAAPRQQNGDREVKRPASPPVPALSKPVDAKPKWYEQEYPDPDAEPIVPKVKKVVKKAPLRPKPVVSRPGALPPTRKSVEQHEASSAPYPIKESSSKSGIKGSETGKQGLPPGFEPPEAIPEHLSTEFALPIEAYGSLIIQCLLGRQFGLREWAMGEITQRTVERTQRESVQDSKLDANSFAEATYLVVQFAIADNREKAITTSVALWTQLVTFCNAQRVPQAVSFKFFDTLVPILLTKSAEMNPRTKQACIDMMVTLGKSFQNPPYSIYPYIFKLDKKSAAHWKLIKARLEILHRLLEAGGLHLADKNAKPNGKNSLRASTRGAPTGSGVPTIAAVMEFTEPFLHHMNVEVREAAGRVVVVVMRAAGEESADPYLKRLRPQQLATLKAMYAEAVGIKAKPIAKGARARPWALPSQVKPVPEVIDEEAAEEVERLETELLTLRQMVGNHHKETISAVNARHLGAPRLSPDEPAPSSMPNRSSPKRKPSSDVMKASKLKGPSKSVTRSIEEDESTSSPRKASPTKKQTNDTEVVGRAANWNIDRTCIFCEELNDDFALEESLDLHYWRDCPVLTNCPNCKLIVEIPMLTDHLTRDCDAAANAPMRVCPRCKEAVKTADFAAHTAKKKCKAAPTDPNTSRCPMCHDDVSGGEEGWRRHLVTGNGCPASPRKPRHESSYADATQPTQPPQSTTQKSIPAVKKENGHRGSLLPLFKSDRTKLPVPQRRR